MSTIRLFSRNSGKTFARNFQYDLTLPVTPKPPMFWQRLRGWLTECRNHDWAINAVNGYGSPSEEVCLKCGEYRHRIHDHRIMGREEWQAGETPFIETMSTTRYIYREEPITEEEARAARAEQIMQALCRIEDLQKEIGRELKYISELGASPLPTTIKVQVTLRPGDEGYDEAPVNFERKTELTSSPWIGLIKP